MSANPGFSVAADESASLDDIDLDSPLDKDMITALKLLEFIDNRDQVMTIVVIHVLVCTDDYTAGLRPIFQTVMH